MPEEFTYAKSGVDRTLRATSKKVLASLEETYRFSRYGEILRLPYGNLIPYRDGCYLDLVIEGIGTKVLVAQLAEKYDTIGIDGVAMAVNDVIRSGARPLAIADNIHAQVSDPYLVQELMKGIVKGAVEAECVIPSGEIGDVSEVIKGLIEGKGFDMVFAAIGEVSKDRVITAYDVRPGDVVIGMRSSGIHSNGITLARKILFKRWGGLYEPYDIPEPLDRELVYEVLEPTRIYVKPLMRVADVVDVKAAVHITGDAYLKFERISRFSKGIGFMFDNFNPHPIFTIIQDAAIKLGGRISDEEMFRTFNMGWGFAIIVDKMNKDEAIDVIERAGIQAEEIGRITDNPGIIEIHYKGQRLFLS